MIKYDDKQFVPYISALEIDKYVEKVAAEMDQIFLGSDSVPIFVSVLSGAYMFTSDLMKKIKFDSVVYFIKVSSYSGIQSTGEVKLIMDLNIDITGRDVIILDEIIDTGRTVDDLVDTLSKRNPASIRVGTLIYKPNAFKGKTKIDFAGYEMMDNKFVIGYGLDYNERGRCLPEIYILDENNKEDKL